MLNPFIYSLRNWDVKGALGNILSRGPFSVWQTLSSIMNWIWEPFNTRYESFCL
jgi:hypothetical protein